MKQMLIIIALLISTHVDAQERVNAQFAQWTDSVGIIDTATGWMLNRDGKWVSLPRTIPVCASSDYDNLLAYEKRGLGIDNFLSYELLTIKQDGIEYAVLIKSAKVGGYKYESIKEGWYEFNSCIAYVVDMAFIDNLRSISKQGVSMLATPILAEYTFVDYKKRHLSIAQKFKKPDKSLNKNLIVHVGFYSEKDIVQFQIYTLEKTSYSTSVGGITREHYLHEEKTYKRIQLYGTEELFKHCYYETTVSGFTRLYSNK